MMSPFKTVALTVSAVLISAMSVQAATPAKKMPMHHAGKKTAAMAHSAPMNADHSADALNAQSLTRSQAPTL